MKMKIEKINIANFLKENIFLLGIVFVGLLLRLFHLGKESIWVDEGFTYVLSKLTLSGYIDNVLGTLRNILPPLYFQLMHYWTSLFGYSEFSLRLPSVIFGTLSIWGIYILGKEMFNKEVGKIAALILAFSLFHIQYSQEARMYEMLSFLSIISFHFFIHFLKKRSWSSALLFSCSNVMLVYTHHYGFFIIITEYLFLLALFFSNRFHLKENVKKLSIATVLFLTLIFPWLFIFINQLKKVYADPWLPVPTVQSLFKLLSSFSGGLTLFGIFIGIFLWRFVITANEQRQLESKENSEKRIYYELLLFWLIVPIVFSFLYSRFASPIFGDKYLIASSIPLYLLLAKSIESFKSIYVKCATVMIVIALSVTSISAYFTTMQKEQWREATAYVEKNAQQNDLVLFNAGFGLQNGFGYYAKRNDIVTSAFPARTWQVNTLVTKDDFPELLQVTNNHQRVWVVYSHSHDTDDLINTKLSESYFGYDCTAFENINVCLFEKLQN
jgi:uncharacterized membrane protein